MKKILTLLFIACLFSCSKKSNPIPHQSSWIIGKWKATIRYSYNQTTQKTDTLAISTELTFDANAAYENGSNVGHSYTIGTSEYNSTINGYNDGGTIKKISDTQFLLNSQTTSIDGLVIYNLTDVYNKE